ncbi:ABC-three component system protein [Luteibacter sp.]|uniref:ABC-three component system protein n=1 Tax=Luteibacter sp. TaxID=1886636 RepID=UPI003F80B2CB
MDYRRHILALTADQLESFVRDWVCFHAAAYFKVEKFSGAGDRGRDVVGFVTKALHEGDWDNYQCKQFSSTLPKDKAFHEIGKVLYYASQGEFTAPREFKFVAPKGVNRRLEELLFKPTEFKQALLHGWVEYCQSTIVSGKSIPLTPELREFILGYDFSSISRINLDELLASSAAGPTLYKWFGADPGPAPVGTAPGKVSLAELPYIGQLIAAYVERGGTPIADANAALCHPIYGQHLTRQRERFYDADAFMRFYRDNTDPETVATFESDVYHGVIDVCEGRHDDALARSDAVMIQAASVSASGVLGKHARVASKQGICHHFANEAAPRLTWSKP